MAVSVLFTKRSISLFICASFKRVAGFSRSFCNKKSAAQSCSLSAVSVTGCPGNGSFIWADTLKHAEEATAIITHNFSMYCGHAFAKCLFRWFLFGVGESGLGDAFRERSNKLLIRQVRYKNAMNMLNKNMNAVNDNKTSYQFFNKQMKPMYQERTINKIQGYLVGGINLRIFG